VTRYRGAAWVALLSVAAPASPGAALVAQERAARIALQEVRLPKAFKERTEVKRFIDSLVTAWVLAIGYDIVPQDTTMTLSRQVNDSIGGLFNPVTGLPDPDKVKAASQALLTRLGNRGAEYQLYPMVIPNTISFMGPTAEWLGTEEETGGRGGLGGVVLGTHTGRIGVLNFGIIVEDLTGTDVYRGSAGIQLSAKIVKGQLVSLATDSLLTNWDRLRAAVELALKGLPAKVPISHTN